MHPKLKTHVAGIYARFSTEMQRESSIEDQIRRGRELIARAGGDPSTAEIFPDYAVSGASLVRPGFEAMMRAVAEKRIGVIVTEDISRISRDFADAAMIFKRLQFLDVPLISVADGIDTSSKNAKMQFFMQSMMADAFLDTLRDKTLRGLEGRMLKGYATGSVPFGFRTVVETDKHGGVIGSRIEIDEEEAAIVRRIFAAYLDDGALQRIARMLNIEGVPSPRAGSRHKRFGWGSSTIRAILYNERYVGIWKFKEKQWVKVPGTNKRLPRNRPADEVITMERPELRIIDADTWAEVQNRLKAIHRKYTQGSTKERVINPKRSSYLLSGLLVCDACSAPMSIHAGTSAAYYRCSANRTKGTCNSSVSVKEEVVRREVLGAIRQRLRSKDGIAFVRKRIAEELRDFSRSLDAELKTCRERLERTDARIKGLIAFIADGDRTESVVSALRDLEVQAKSDRATIESLRQEQQQPLRLPSVEEISSAVFELDARLIQDMESARTQLRRWLHNSEIRIATKPEGVVAIGAILPAIILLEKATSENGQRHRAVTSLWSRSSSGGRI